MRVNPTHPFLQFDLVGQLHGLSDVFSKQQRCSHMENNVVTYVGVLYVYI